MEGDGHHSFQCSEDFSLVAHCDGTVTSEPDTEIWLIKAPPDFTPESFNTHRFPLSGYKMQKIKDGGLRKYYHVVSSPCTDLPMKTFLQPSGDQEDQLVATAPLQGVITLSEAHGDHTAVHSVPDRPPLSLPLGLKHRYCPFGAVVPVVREVSKGKSQLSGSSKKKKKAKKRRLEEMQDGDA
ncbi:DNA-directed RNA polymerase I subunit RPA34 [Leptodactylus fuscus]|uniref:DNA-directed RNA polymerase I subunit RPA34 n=1 Tax=Leptodactylus fuscus TaxID=238119 RepID=UPI003F4E6D05